MKTTQTCSVDGCERTAWARGVCGMHYQRQRTSGELALIPLPSPAERLAAGLVLTPNGCLEWTGVMAPKNYGRISVNGRQVATHRLAWELVHGPIPEGMCVCHACDNPPCCEPTHLFLGTVADNNADMRAKGHGSNQSVAVTHCPQGHPYNGPNLYVLPNGRRVCRACKNARKRAARRRLRNSQPA